jgi:hypothetical protein
MVTCRIDQAIDEALSSSVRPGHLTWKKIKRRLTDFTDDKYDVYRSAFDLRCKHYGFSVMTPKRKVVRWRVPPSPLSPDSSPFDSLSGDMLHAIKRAISGTVKPIYLTWKKIKRNLDHFSGSKHKSYRSLWDSKCTEYGFRKMPKHGKVARWQIPSSMRIWGLRDVKGLLRRNRPLGNLGGSNGGTQGSLSPKSLHTVLALMTTIGNCRITTFVDAGCGDGRVMLVAASSGLFDSIVGCDIMESEGECEASYQARIMREGLSTLIPLYGMSIEDLVVKQPKPIVVFSFLQGWCPEDMSKLARWVVGNHVEVFFFCGHRTGRAAVASQAMITTFWKPLLPGYEMHSMVQLKMQYSYHAITGVMFRKAYKKRKCYIEYSTLPALVYKRQKILR